MPWDRMQASAENWNRHKDKGELWELWESAVLRPGFEPGHTNTCKTPHRFYQLPVSPLVHPLVYYRHHKTVNWTLRFASLVTWQTCHSNNCFNNILNSWKLSTERCSSQSRKTDISSPKHKNRDSTDRLEGPGIESRSGAKFSAFFQTSPGLYSASNTMGTGSLYRGVALTTHPLHRRG
jgi:hypothetical protein